MYIEEQIVLITLVMLAGKAISIKIRGFEVRIRI
jgi:hypothetical protein